MTRPEVALGLQGCRCVVLGAGGFIGTNLVKALIAHGADIRCFGHKSRFPSATQDVPWVEGDYEDPFAVERALDGREFVFHLLGSSVPATANQQPRVELASTATNTLRLLDQCRDWGVRRIIFASSGGTVYGAAKQLPIAETALPAPIGTYGLGKLMVEGFLALYEQLYGLGHIALRIANPYGPYQTDVHSQGVVAAALARGLRGEPLEIWGTGDVVRDFVYIDDVCDAIVRAMNYRGRHRVFNVGSGVGRSINFVATDIDRLLKPRGLERVYRPGRPVDVPASVVSPHRIETEMGWFAAVPWEEGLRRTLAWMQATAMPIGHGAR